MSYEHNLAWCPNLFSNTSNNTAPWLQFFMLIISPVSTMLTMLNSALLAIISLMNEVSKDWTYYLLVILDALEYSHGPVIEYYLMEFWVTAGAKYSYRGAAMTQDIGTQTQEITMTSTMTSTIQESVTDHSTQTEDASMTSQIQESVTDHSTQTDDASMTSESQETIRALELKNCQLMALLDEAKSENQRLLTMMQQVKSQVTSSTEDVKVLDRAAYSGNSAVAFCSNYFKTFCSRILGCIGAIAQDSATISAPGINVPANSVASAPATVTNSTGTVNGSSDASTQGTQVLEKICTPGWFPHIDKIPKQPHVPTMFKLFDYEADMKGYKIIALREIHLDAKRVLDYKRSCNGAFDALQFDKLVVDGVERPKSSPMVWPRDVKLRPDGCGLWDYLYYIRDYEAVSPCRTFKTVYKRYMTLLGDLHDVKIEEVVLANATTSTSNSYVPPPANQQQQHPSTTQQHQQPSTTGQQQRLPTRQQPQYQPNPTRQQPQHQPNPNRQQPQYQPRPTQQQQQYRSQQQQHQPPSQQQQYRNGKPQQQQQQQQQGQRWQSQQQQEQQQPQQQGPQGQGTRQAPQWRKSVYYLVI
ncbi:hypothetical protein HDU76_004316 [Blyttiomyces sp. JEL0837]|nr:hypothetical protein HDU76_004316 [Blyttiomyces sp. JEL0837]